VIRFPAVGGRELRLGRQHGFFTPPWLAYPDRQGSHQGEFVMRLNVHSLNAVALLLSLVGSPCPADEKVARTDSNGDPLPAGAIARLGTCRLDHAGRVFTLAYSQDGKWLASAGADGIIRLWDAATGKASLSLEGHKKGVHNLVFLQPGEGKPATVLVSASWDRTVRFWDLKTGKELARVTNHPGMETVLAVSPDGKLLASAGNKESRIFLWRVEDGKEVRRWKAHQGGVTALAFAPDGKSIASGGVAQPESSSPHADEPNDDYGVALWETDTGKPRRTFTGHPTIVRRIAFSADGKLHAFCGGKGHSMLSWDAETGKQLRAVGDRFNLDNALSLALTRDCRTLVAGDFGDSIRLFDTDTGAEQRRIETGIMRRAYGLAISPDGLTLAAAGDNGRIRLWDMSRGTQKSIVPRA
jgi:WD40 repeat protein